MGIDTMIELGLNLMALGIVITTTVTVAGIVTLIAMALKK